MGRALCRLRALDVELMKQVHDKVNLIPVIAKADTLTKEELMAFKKRIVEDLAYHHINTFSIETDPSDDAETINTAKELMVRTRARPAGCVGMAPGLTDRYAEW